MYFTIDRFEGDFAVLEDENRSMIDVSRKLLPEEVTEGDVLLFVDDNYTVDEEETARRKADAQARMEKLWKK